MKLSQFTLTIPIENNEFLLYNTFSSSLIKINKKQYDFFGELTNETLKNMNTNNSFLDILIDKHYVIDDTWNEISMLKYKQNVAKFSTHDFSLTIIPTMECNFKCIYCYEDMNSKGVMNIETQNKIYEYLSDMKKDGLKKLHISWYGGEPLLCFELISSFSKKIKTLFHESDDSITFSAVTNAYLLNEDIIKTMVELNFINIQITIDGPQIIHDNRRMLKNGKPTFEQIVKNCTLCDKNGLNYTIRTNIDQSNNNYIEELLLYLKENGIDNSKVYLGHVMNYNDNLQLQCMSKESFSNEIIKFDEISKSISGVKKEYPSQKANYCSADRVNSAVINFNGDMYKCWLDVGNKNRVYGNINNNSYENISIFSDYINYDFTTNKICTDCKVLPLCMGGCPYLRHNKEDFSCTEFKFNIDAVIKRHYKQKSNERRP